MKIKINISKAVVMAFAMTVAAGVGHAVVPVPRSVTQCQI